MKVLINSLVFLGAMINGFFYESILNRKYRKKINIFCILVCVFFMRLLLLFPMSQGMYWIVIIVQLVPEFILICILYTDKTAEKLLVNIKADIAFKMGLLWGYIISDKGNTIIFYFVDIFVESIILLQFFIAAKKKSKVCNESKNKLSIYMGIEILCFLYVAGQTAIDNTKKISILIGILTGVVILMYVIISGCQGTGKKTADMQHYIQAQINTGNEEIIEFIKKEEKYLKEQIQLIDNELFREYLNDGKGDNDKILRYLFEDRKKRAEKLNIKLDINWDDSIQQNDKSIVPIWDMVSIISNLLDNGLEAVWENAAEKRWIRLIGSIERDCLSIEVLNPYNRKIRIIDGEIKTTKSDENNHGMGLKIIRDISEKYGMVMNVSTNNNIFKVSISKNEDKYMNFNN